MKNLKKTSLLLALVSIITIGFTSCHKDDHIPGKPVIKLSEVGHKDSKHAHPGHDLHLEATITAHGLIKQIEITIQQEGENPFLIKKTFSEGQYIGVRNIKFHEHIDIPAEAPLGKYQLHFVVTDQRGQLAKATSPLEVVKDDGTEEHEEHHHE